jgi:hypothetical protein
LSSPGSRYDKGLEGCSDDLTGIMRATDLLDLRPVLRELVLVRHGAGCSYNTLSKTTQKALYKRFYNKVTKKVKTR